MTSTSKSGHWVSLVKLCVWGKIATAAAAAAHGEHVSTEVSLCEPHDLLNHQRPLSESWVFFN